MLAFFFLPAMRRVGGRKEDCSALGEEEMEGKKGVRLVSEKEGEYATAHLVAARLQKFNRLLSKWLPPHKREAATRKPLLSC